MAFITSKVDICNLALSGTGNRNSVNDIDIPVTDKEQVCALWYDITRQLVLKTMVPNFALDRVTVSAKTTPTSYTGYYTYCWEKPVYALKILGIGAIDEKQRYDYAVEGDSIFTVENFEDGLPIRIIRDITDVSAMSPEFVIALAKELEKRITMPVTQDPGKKKMATTEAAVESSNSTALNAQENPPIRRSNSKFMASRNAWISTTNYKA